ncbi:unnamed protein product [Rhizoctonia solani]|uniref:Uncharacterized protein n=1 Tax=Rhizoctonia solani TaxID=456999 RepID=A0A8H3HRR3_9AGAM|nr:unnamed protein product [Rhizoctonia solani]
MIRPIFYASNTNGQYHHHTFEYPFHFPAITFMLARFATRIQFCTFLFISNKKLSLSSNGASADENCQKISIPSFLRIKVDDKTSPVSYRIPMVPVLIYPVSPTATRVGMSSELGKDYHSHELVTSSSSTFAQIPPAFV